MKLLRWLTLALAAGIAAGASAALQSEEFLNFSPVPGSVVYLLLLLIGLGTGFLVKSVQEGLLMSLLILAIGSITLFLALYVPNIEIVPEFILGSVWWGALTIFLLTLIGIFVGRIVSGE